MVSQQTFITIKYPYSEISGTIKLIEQILLLLLFSIDSQLLVTVLCVCVVVEASNLHNQITQVILHHQPTRSHSRNKVWSSRVADSFSLSQFCRREDWNQWPLSSMCVVVIIKQVKMYTPEILLFLPVSLSFLYFWFHVCLLDLSLFLSLEMMFKHQEIQTLGLNKWCGKGGKSHKSALISTSDSTYEEQAARQQPTT